jgi:cell wall-associated NlpC family hydrolase
MEGDRIIETARSYKGVRFRHQGRARHTGVDCLGLLICVAHDLALKWDKALLPKLEERDYSHTPDEDYFRQSLELFLQPSPSSTLQAGEVALMKIGGRVQHVGIIAAHPTHHALTLIHAYAPARKVVEHGVDAYWERAMVARYRLPAETVQKV